MFSLPRGLSEKRIKEISRLKREPAWMLDFRLSAFKTFLKKKTPGWGADLSEINFDDIYSFIRAAEKPVLNWQDVPETIKSAFDKLGLPEAEQKFLAGSAAQYDSGAIYLNLKKEWEKSGVIFCDTDGALRNHSEIFKKYFGSVVPPEDNKFAALNSAFWSGGAFVYIPDGVKVALPLQAYFRINARNLGQFERTLIVAGRNCEISYIEACSAPVYSASALHAGVVEVVAQEGARVRYTTVQNWSKNVYNLTTKRAFAEENALVEWIDANLGSRATMKYPSVFLRGRGARADIISVAFAGRNQHQDAGAKVIHLAPQTSSRIVSKSVAAAGGRTSFRALVKIAKGAKKSKAKMICKTLLLDEKSKADAYPVLDIAENETAVEHEAAVSKLSEDQLFYLASRGIKESDAAALMVSGFVDEFSKELPMEYAAELNGMLKLEMEDAIG